MKKNTIYFFVATIAVITVLLLIYVVVFSSYDSKDKKKINVVTSFYPIYIATMNLTDGVDNINLTCLANPEVGCLHDYQLTVNDMITLENADLFIINGLGMEAFLDKAVSAYPKLQVIDSSKDILIEQHFSKNKHEYEYDNRYDEYKYDNDEHNHDHDENSHIWVSIELYENQIENIAKELISKDTENKDIYEANLANYKAKLNALKKEMEEKLIKIENKNIVTFHEAFEYFAEEFDLNIVSVIEREPGTSPNAKEVAEIIDLLNGKNVNAIFVEPNYSKTAADTISKETNVPIYELNPLVSGPFEKDAYINIMKNNLETLVKALDK